MRLKILVLATWATAAWFSAHGYVVHSTPAPAAELVCHVGRINASHLAAHPHRPKHRTCRHAASR